MRTNCYYRRASLLFDSAKSIHVAIRVIGNAEDRFLVWCPMFG